MACWLIHATKECGEAGETPLYMAAGLDDPQIAQVLRAAVYFLDRRFVAPWPRQVLLAAEATASLCCVGAWPETARRKTRFPLRLM